MTQELDDFLFDAPKKAKLFVGIDPGVTGAIGFIQDGRALSLSIPCCKIKTGKKTRSAFDYGGIIEIFNVLFRYRKANFLDITIALEAIPLSLGPGRKTAEILLNRAYAIWPLFLQSRRYRVEEVRPQVWKKHFSLLKKDKQASRLLAQKLFPKVNLSLKKDVDRAEALLIAEYTKQVR